MINEKLAIKYCKNDISQIENYDKAIADKSQVWHCHHRRETIYSRSGLIEIGEYYNRPAEELIFLTPADHHRLHNLGKHLSEDTRQKLSESNNGENNPRFGKHHSEETRKKMSESKKGKPSWINGKHHSEESRKKISESMNGENNPMFGKHHSEETLKMMSETQKGNYFFNNGVKSIRAKECPGPEWQRGRIKKKNSGN